MYLPHTFKFVTPCITSFRTAGTHIPSLPRKVFVGNTILRYLSFLVMSGTKQQTIRRKKRKPPVRHRTDPPASGPAPSSSSSEASTSVPQSPVTSPATSTPASTQLTPSATHTPTPEPSSASATTPSDQLPVTESCASRLTCL